MHVIADRAWYCAGVAAQDEDVRRELARVGTLDIHEQIEDLAKVWKVDRVDDRRASEGFVSRRSGRPRDKGVGLFCASVVDQQDYACALLLKPLGDGLPHAAAVNTHVQF